ncbi:MAG: CZB domain-containing protein [Pseudomonadota bacterium]
MDKRVVIAQLRKAKSAHIRWRSYAQALVAGVPMDEGKVPVIHTDCEFGKWYYSDGQALAGIDAFQAIAEPHEQLHSVYMEIFKHLFEEENVGLFQRLIGKKASSLKGRRAAVESLLAELLRISERLLGHIEALEQRVIAMEESQLAELF